MPNIAINQRGAITTDPIRNFRFLVKFLPLTSLGTQSSLTFNPSIGFTSVSGLAISTESIPYREGGYNTTVHQIPGQTTFSPVTFQRGVSIGSRQNWDWMRRLFQTVAGNYSAFSSPNSFRTDVEIHVLNHPVPYASAESGSNYGGQLGNLESAAAGDDLVVARFRLYNAWPVTVAYSDLNAGDNALFVEQMTLVHEGMDMQWATESNGSIAEAPDFV
jgi:phage tail-like protein